MNLAKISANAQITVPIEVRRRLRLAAGDKVLFVENPGGDVLTSNAATSALTSAQAAFADAAEVLDVKSEDDVTALVDGLRAGRTAVD